MNYYLKVIAADQATGAFREYADVWIGNGYYTHMNGEVMGNQIVIDQDILKPFLRLPSNGIPKPKICFSYQVIDSTSLDELIKDNFEFIRKKAVNDYRWRLLSHSVEYMKLSAEEKANVKEDFDFYEEPDGDPYEKALASLLGIKYIIQSVENSLNVEPNKVYGIVYNGEAFKDEEE